MAIAICVLLAGLAIGFTLFVREQDIPPAPVENPELKHLYDRRAVLYENLKDLQFEYHQGKLSDEDYQSLKQGFLYDLAGVMDSIERMEVRKEKPAKSARKAGTQTATPVVTPIATKDKRVKENSDTVEIVCGTCQASNPAANRFCGRCGAALKQPDKQ